MHRYFSNYDAEKVLDKIEKMKLLAFVFGLQGEVKDVDKFFEKLENIPEMAAVSKDNNNALELKAFLRDNFHADDPNLTYKENFKNGLRVGMEFFHIEEKQH